VQFALASRQVFGPALEQWADLEVARIERRIEETVPAIVAVPVPRHAVPPAVQLQT
jgi:hypothetical protein